MGALNIQVNERILELEASIGRYMLETGLYAGKRRLGPSQIIRWAIDQLNQNKLHLTSGDIQPWVESYIVHTYEKEGSRKARGVYFNEKTLAQIDEIGAWLNKLNKLLVPYLTVRAVRPAAGSGHGRKVYNRTLIMFIALEYAYENLPHPFRR